MSSLAGHHPANPPNQSSRRTSSVRSRAAALLLLAAACLPLVAVSRAAPSDAQGTQPGPTPRGLTDTSASPHVKVRSVGLGDVRWTHGFWAQRFATCRHESLPQLWRILGGTAHSQFYHNFLIAA